MRRFLCATTEPLTFIDIKQFLLQIAVFQVCLWRMKNHRLATSDSLGKNFFVLPVSLDTRIAVNALIEITPVQYPLNLYGVKLPSLRWRVAFSI
jgi:hypothetical protein